MGISGYAVKEAEEQQGYRLFNSSRWGLTRLRMYTLGMSLFLLVSHFSSGVFAQAPSYVYDFAWSPDGSRIVVARGESAVQVLDATTLQVLVTLQHPQVRVAAWSPDGTRLATGGWDETIRIWDPTTGQLLATIDSLVDYVTSIEWTSDNSRLIASGYLSGYRVWDASTYQFLKTFMGGQHEMDLSPDDTQLAVARWRGVGILNAETGETIALLEGHQREVFSVAWSPDGTKLASGGYDGTMRLWDATTYQQILVLQTPDNSIVRVVWSPDGNLIAGIGGGQLNIWNAVTGEQLAAFNVLGRDIAWNPNEMEFIYSRSDATLEIAHVLSGSTCIATAPADPPTYTVAAGDPPDALRGPLMVQKVYRAPCGCGRQAWRSLGRVYENPKTGLTMLLEK